MSLQPRNPICPNEVSHPSGLPPTLCSAKQPIAKEVLLKQGLAAALLDDLAKSLDRFEAEGNAINLSRRAHICARVELGEVTGNLSELVKVLDAFNRYRFQANPEQLAVWNAARSVVGHSPQSRGSVPPPTPNPTDGSTRAA